MFADGKPEDGNQVIRVKGQKWVLFSLGSPILLPLNENSDKEEGTKSKRLVVSQPICTLGFLFPAFCPCVFLGLWALDGMSPPGGEGSGQSECV